MNKRKRLFLIIAVSIAAVFCIWFMVLDFSRFINLDYRYDIYPSALLKRINVMLAALIAWASGKDGLSPKDGRRMKGAFAFVVLGEAAFAMGERSFGVWMFAFCQTLLILRNTAGLRDKLASADHKQKKSLLIAGFIIFLAAAAVPALSGNLVKPDSTLITAYLYGVILSASLWAGFACNILGLLPRKNSLMAASGMVCFYCCDVLVGLDAELDSGLPWLLANSFIWVFYIPALVLLGLSCYKYN
jgi:hypothetical protein